MKNLLRLTIFCLLFIGIITTTKAQNYTSSIGFRLGYPVSLSYKLFISESAAIEAFVSYSNNKTTSFGYNYGWTRIGFGAAYQIHQDISSVDGLVWYYGGGASILYYNYSDDAYYSGYKSLSIGLQGNIGLDYTFDSVPVNLSVDWVPTFFINGFVSGFGAGYGALSVRYILGGQ